MKDEKASELLELPDPNRRSNNLGPGIGNTKKLHAFDSALFTETGSDGVPTASCGPGSMAGPVSHDSYLVDPASSHMLVSKIKPCMSKYKQIFTVKLRMAH